jgi:hypothetical protein
MYWFCHHCRAWRADTYVRIDPRTLHAQCTYCDSFLKYRLTDGEYKELSEQHPLGVPDPDTQGGAS